MAKLSRRGATEMNKHDKGRIVLVATGEFYRAPGRGLTDKASQAYLYTWGEFLAQQASVNTGAANYLAAGSYSLPIIDFEQITD